MKQIYVDLGLVFWLQKMVADGLSFHLFTNNATPNRETTLGGLTEATWTNYSPILVSGGSFTLFGVAGHRGHLSAADISFLNDSGGTQTAYGYYITDGDGMDPLLLAAARFDDAPLARDDQDSWNIVPRIGDFSEFAS